MQPTTMIAVALAPFLTPLIREAALWPGRRVHDYLRRAMPESRLRTFLLKPRGKPRL